LLQYADYQFGKPIIRKNYRERTDGQRIANWNVDINILLKINTTITDIYLANDSLSKIIREEEAFPHLEKSLHILSPWIVTVGTDATNQSNSLNSEMTNYLLEQTYSLERDMSIVAMNN
jgi:hypothetical protein